MISGSSSFGPPAVRDDRHLRGKALDVVGLLVQQALRDQQREVDVGVAGRLDAAVDAGLDRLPDRVAVGTDDHRPAGKRVLGQLGPFDHLLVPGGKVFGLLR